MAQRLFALLHKGCAPFDPFRAAQVLSRSLRIPRYRLLRRLRDCGGILAQGLPESKARNLATSLSEADVPTFILPLEEMVEFPPAVPVGAAKRTSEGIILTPRFGRAGQVVSKKACEVKWKDIVLVTAARVRFRERQKRNTVDLRTVVAGRYSHTYLVPGSQSVEQALFRDCADIFAVEPVYHLRIDASTFQFRTIGIEGGKTAFSNFLALLRFFRRNAEDAYFDKGVRLFLDGDPKTRLTAQNERAYNNYTRWLVQLLYHPEAGELPPED